MKRHIILSGFLATVLFTPAISFAQLASGNAGKLGVAVTGFTNLINTYLVPFLIALAVLAFIYGVFTYFIAGGADEDKRASGRSLMLYALIGFVAIIALWGIVNFVEGAFGFTDKTVGSGPAPVKIK